MTIDKDPQLSTIYADHESMTLPVDGVTESFIAPLDLDTGTLAVSSESLNPDEIRSGLEEIYEEAEPTRLESPSTGNIIAQSGTLPGLQSDGMEEIVKRPNDAESMLGRIRSSLSEFFGGKSAMVRSARAEDLDVLTDIDIATFDQVYRDYDVDPEIFRKDQRDMIADRLGKLGSWITVFEQNGEVQGFITTCPTNKRPEDFVSWEDTTDNGTLETTFDPSGERLYVVSLSVLPSGTAVKGQNMLFLNQIGRFIRGGYDEAFFESRIPGLRRWVRRQGKRDGIEVEELSEEQIEGYANEYFTLTKEVDGKEVPYDRLLRLYHGVGCRFVKLVSDAYKDEPSMNYGVECVFDNPVPKGLRKNRLVKNVVGGLVQIASHSPWITKKLFG